MRSVVTTHISTNISDGDGEPDYAIIHKADTKVEQMIILIKIDHWVMAFPFTNFIVKDYSVILNINEMGDKNQAYDQLMRWIGKMTKKSVNSRYFNRKVDKKYSLPEDITIRIKMDKLADNLKQYILEKKPLF